MSRHIRGDNATKKGPQGAHHCLGRPSGFRPTSGSGSFELNLHIRRRGSNAEGAFRRHLQTRLGSISSRSNISSSRHQQQQSASTASASASAASASAASAAAAARKESKANSTQPLGRWREKPGSAEYCFSHSFTHVDLTLSGPGVRLAHYHIGLPVPDGKAFAAIFP